MNLLALTRTNAGIMVPRDNYVEIFRWLHTKFGQPGRRWSVYELMSVGEPGEYTLKFAHDEDRVLFLLTWA